MLVIRSFRPSDLEKVKRLSDNTLREPYDPSLFTTIYALSPEGFIVAVDGGEVVGFVLGVEEDRMLRILMLAVDERYRCRGVGSALFDELLCRFSNRNLSGITLEVRTNNSGAIDFYRKRGFEIVEILPGYYTDGSPAYKMVRKPFF